MATTITSLDQLKTLYDAPRQASIKKQSTELTDAYRLWLEQSCFFVIASVGVDGVDCTPRGDEPGQAFRITDAKTILIPDRRGNNRLDTLSNIIAQPAVALLFFIPGVEQTLRIKGRASILIEPSVLEKFSIDGIPPVSCIRVDIESVFFQNARALARSGMWESMSTTNLNTVPTPIDMMKSIDPDFDSESSDAKSIDADKR